MTALETPWAGRRTNLVLAWVALYTHRLPPEVASERREEIRSDLFEQHEDNKTSRGVVARAFFGIPADLSWRDDVLREDAERRFTNLPSSAQRSVRRLIAGTYVVAGVLLTLGLASAIRGFQNHSYPVAPNVSVWASAATFLLAVSLVLFSRPSSRLQGSIGLAFFVHPLFWIVVMALPGVSVQSSHLLTTALTHLPAIIRIPVMLAPGTLAAVWFIYAGVRLCGFFRCPTSTRPHYADSA